MNVGGAVVYINAQGQQRLQTELNSLYAERSVMRNAMEQLQYIESVLGPKLEERAIPADFRYLCLPAITTADASGAYWGLDARRASRLNLRVDNSVDERLNVASSSEAVLTELAALHTKYPSWMRVLLAYANGQRADDFAAPTATSEPVQLTTDTPLLVWQMLARKVAFDYETAQSRPGTLPYLLYDYRQGRGKTLAAIARELGVDQSRFMPFNEWLRVRVIPTDKVYPVLIRLTSAEYLAVRGQVNSTVQLGQPSQPGTRRDAGFPVLRRLSASTSKDPLIRSSAIFYEINDRKGIQAQPCDNSITLAYYGSLSVSEFMKINDLTDRDLVRAGEIYYLETKATRARIPFHVMLAGQTLREVSTTYGIRLKSLLKYNHLENNQRLQPGRILWLRERRPNNVPAEYQVLPETAPQPDPTITQRQQSRENEESVIDNAPPNSPRPPDSTSMANRNRPGIGTPGDDLTSAAGPAAPLVQYYTVKQGDTHSGVAERYKMALPDLMTLNKLSYRTPLVAGQRLIVSRPPMAKPAEVTRPATNPVAVTRPPAMTSTARPTPTPSATAAAGASVSPVRPAAPNTTGRNREYAESVVDVSRPAPAPPPQRIINRVRVETPKVNGNAYYHIVQRGQTVYRVALINKVSVSDIVRWNNLSGFSIEVGQRILIRKPPY